MAGEPASLDFQSLVAAIRHVDKDLAAQAGRAVNISLTLCNWLIGLHIAEFELRGADRASYGDRLLGELSRELRGQKVSNTGRRQLYNYVAFYRAYPHNCLSRPGNFSMPFPTATSSFWLISMTTSSAGSTR